jgi:hypothetical protein
MFDFSHPDQPGAQRASRPPVGLDRARLAALRRALENLPDRGAGSAIRRADALTETLTAARHVPA